MTSPLPIPPPLSQGQLSLTEKNGGAQTEQIQGGILQIALSCALTVLRSHQTKSSARPPLSDSAYLTSPTPENLRDLIVQAQTTLPCTLFTKALAAYSDNLEQVSPTLNLKATDPSTLLASSLSETDIWRSGTAYTPFPLAIHIISQLFSLKPPPATHSPASIIDPACGCGVFLRAVTEILATSGYSAKQLTKLLVENLVGIDTNADALLIAEFSLLLAFRRHFPSVAPKDLPSLLGSSLLCDNYLTPSPTLTSRGLTGPGTVDYFIGNPPFGLSRDGRIDAGEARIQKELHGSKLGGNISSYLLFLSAGFTSVKPGGSLALITPNAWLGIKSAHSLRKHLLSEGAILRIEENPAEIFSDRGVETITTYLIKEAHSPRITLARVSHPQTIAHDYASISTKSCTRRPAHTIPLRWSDELDEIFSRIAATSKPIRDRRDLFLPMIALQEYAVGQGEPPQTRQHSKERRYHSDTPVDETSMPFLRGKDVDQYHLSWSGAYLSYGPWLAQPGKRRDYETPRVIIREITGKRPHLIRACATDAALFYNRSLLHILVTAPNLSERSSRGTDLALALSGLLNSTIINAFFYFHGRKVQRALFPKIVCDDLKDIPIPNTFEDRATELARGVREKTGSEREEWVNAIVREMFSLSAADQTQLGTLLCSPDR